MQTGIDSTNRFTRAVKSNQMEHDITKFNTQTGTAVRLAKTTHCKGTFSGHLAGGLLIA